jgi:multidrug resistance efflux pump
MTTANVTSIDAPRKFRAALVRFVADVDAALIVLELEARKPMEWVEGDRPQYWRQAARKASEQLAEARVALERCQVRISGEDTRFCFDERKALEKAKRRLQLADDKVQSLRRWRVEMQKAVEELQVQLGRAKHYLETDIAKAIPALDRIAAALDRYVEKGTSTGS